MTNHSVVFENPSAGVSLSGTLSLPGTGGRCPAVVLIQGQGPLDRDMSLAHLKPFKTLAEHLAANGIASLRYDKRGVGDSGGDFGSATREDLAGDVSAALRFLKRHEGIIPGRIGLLGQSEGAVIAPMVASRSDDVAFVVLLAGPAVSGRENLSLSFAMFAQASPSNDLGVPDFKRLLDRLFDLVSLESPSRADQDAAMQLAESVAPHVINERTNMVLGGTDVTAEQFIGLLSSGCFQGTFESAPETCLSRLICPVLALFGDKDKHVSARENMAAMKSSLEAAGNRDYTVETLAGSNHLFQHCETGFPDEYFTIDHDISPDVLDRVSDWIAGIVRLNG
jgi:fermentation-respiration switch protein FrsA (DUF1100 family)